MSQGFPTPFAINKILPIPGPKGDPGGAGPQGPGQGIDLTAHGGDGGGSIDNTAAFALATTAAAADPSRVVYVPEGAYKLASTQTLTANLKFAPGAMLKPAAGQTITFSGLVLADPKQQIFDVSLGGTVTLAKNQKASPGWWGAKGSGLVSDDAAIQACLDSIPVYEAGHTGDAFQNAPDVLVAPGKYLISKPILINKLGMKFLGAGPLSTRFERASNFMGPMFIAAPDNAMSLPLDTSLVTGPGQSLRMDPTGATYGVNLKDTPRANFDGMTAITIEFFIKVSSAHSGSGNALESSGSIKTGVGGDQMFHVAINGTGPYNVQTLFTTTAGVANPGNLTATLAANTIHHIAITYDGSHVRWWVDGVLDTEIAKSGAVLQQFYEAVMIGWGSGNYPEDTNHVPFNGWLDSVRFSNSVRYTTNFTAPTAKFALDNSTLILLNFDKQYHGCLVADVSGNIDGLGTASSLCYLWSRPPIAAFGVLPFGQIEIGNFGLDCRAWSCAGIINFSPGSYVHDIEIDGCVRGLNWFNNNYESACERVVLSIGQPGAGNTGLGGTYRTAGDFGFYFGTSGITTVTGCFVTGGAVPLVSDGSSLLVTDFTVGVNAAAQVCFIAKPGDNSTFNGFFVDNEAPSSLWIAGVLLNGSGTTTFINSNIDISEAGNSGVPVVEQVNNSVVSGQNKGVFIGSTLYPGPGGMIVKGVSMQVTPVNFWSCGQAGSNAPVAWGDGANAFPSLDGVVVRIISSGASSTAYDWDQVIALKVAGVYDLTTAANPRIGQALVVKDQQGDAGTNTKTVTAHSGHTIDGSSTITITSNYGRASLLFDGSSDYMS